MQTTTDNKLDQHYPLTPQQIDQFKTQGFIKLKNVFDPETLSHYGKHITQEVMRRSTQHLPMEKRDTYSKAFLQVGNIWEENQTVKELVLGKRLGQIATELLGTKGVRLYHDQALYKEPSGGISPWHTDQFYWPLATEQTVTAWIPLQKTPLEMGPLAFSARSQNLTFGRDLAISDESEILIQKALDDGGYTYQESLFDLGEVSFHYGYTYHRAGANITQTPREVMTIIFMDSEMRAIAPKTPYQQNDLEDWCNSTPPGEIIQGPLNPIIYQS